MNPDTRRLLRVGLGELPAERTAATMTMLMGRAESRRAGLGSKSMGTRSRQTSRRTAEVGRAKAKIDLQPPKTALY